MQFPAMLGSLFNQKRFFTCCLVVASSVTGLSKKEISTNKSLLALIFTFVKVCHVVLELNFMPEFSFP